MITLFIIGVLVLAIKLTIFAMKAAWGITKAILFVAFLPITLIVLLAVGLTYAAIPLLVIALLGAFLRPVFRGV